MNTFKFFKSLLLLCCTNIHLSTTQNTIDIFTGMEIFKNKNWLNQNAWFQIQPLQEILQKNPLISYQKIIEEIPFNCPEFIVSPKFPHQGYFNELFILSIPNGKVQGEHGYVFINNLLPDEMARGDRFECLLDIQKIEPENSFHIPGKVAVIAQHGASRQTANYYHWICEVLGRLALLELANIQYDWLYIGFPKKFMYETLELWGVDFSKIIFPKNDNVCIQADELIVPSLVINTNVGHKHAGNFQHPIILQYVREKLLKAAQSKNIDTSHFAKNVFISRKDAYNARRILNEDEIFELFKEKNFKSYELSKLSVAEQIILLHNADIVVSEQGSGLTNILFCKKNTMVIEIFQALVDNCFWWISHACNLKYVPITTIPVDADYFAEFRDKSFLLMCKSFCNQTIVPLDTIRNLVATLP